MEKVHKHGQMVENMKVILSMVLKKVKEFTLGQMEKNMMDNGKMANKMVKVHSQHQKVMQEEVFGQMV